MFVAKFSVMTLLLYTIYTQCQPETQLKQSHGIQSTAAAGGPLYKSLAVLYIPPGVHVGHAIAPIVVNT